MNIRYRMSLLLLAIITMISNYSCRKLEGADPMYYVPAPTALTLDLKNTTLTANWEYAAKDDRVVGFAVSVASDKEFKTIIKTDTTGADGRTASFNNLGYFAAAYVRVRALANDIVINSEYVTAAVQPDNYFNSIDRSKLTTTSVVLSWNATEAGTVTHILLIPANAGEEQTIQLSASEISAGSKTVENLDVNSPFTAVLFNGTVRKGVITFATRDPNASIVINSGPIIYDTLQDAINAAASGDVIDLGPSSYGSGSETITINNKSLTIKAADNTDALPVITLKNFDLKGNISSFKISGVKIVSTSHTILTGNTDYNKHIFGLTYVTGAINLTVENCDLSGAESGLCFTQAATATNAPSPISGTGTFNLTVDNCLLHDFGNAGGDFIDFRSGAIGNVNYKNSTFWNGARSFLRTDNTASIVSGAIIAIENSTFYNFSSGGAFIRIAAPNTAVVINKCILLNKATNNGNTVTGSTLKLNTNNISGSNAANITSGVTSGFNIGTTALDPAFSDAAVGNFTVGNATLKAAGIGDPRWIQ